MARYQIKLINTKTNETRLTTFCFTNRKKAEEWCKQWNEAGEPFGAEVIDTKKK